jgi:hypothetical protein
VEVLKLAHAGRFLIENPSVARSGSAAVGRKLYAVPTVALVAGVPVIDGGRLLPEPEPAVIVNRGNVARDRPSLTLIRMFRQLPAVGALPSSRPE